MELFEIELFICIKMDLALNNLQWLRCNKTNQSFKLIISEDLWSEEYSFIAMTPRYTLNI